MIIPYNTPLFKLSGNLRSLIHCALKRKGYKKNTKSQIILGAEFEIVQKHLIQTFEMSYCIPWDDEYNDWIEMDHVYPVSKATSEEHMIELNHYSNLQYLFKQDNQLKKDKLNFKL